jgi:hypothetical protein
MEVDADRDEAADDEERDHQDNGDEPRHALGHGAYSTAFFLPRSRLAAGAARVPE